MHNFSNLFAFAMILVVKTVEVEYGSQLSKSGVRQPLIRAYMDDLTVSTSSVLRIRWILQGLGGLPSGQE